MKEQRITVDIDRDGRVTADAEGFTGDACLKDLERLLEGLASTPDEVTRKTAAGAALVTGKTVAKVTTGRKP
jgi:hypothetical protein